MGFDLTDWSDGTDRTFWTILSWYYYCWLWLLPFDCAQGGRGEFRETWGVGDKGARRPNSRSFAALQDDMVQALGRDFTRRRGGRGEREG
jgi:hypothetical protein